LERADSTQAKADAEFLADLEHVLRLPRNPDRSCIAEREREREPHLPVPRRAARHRGAVVASALPWSLANVFDVGTVAEPGQLRESVMLALYLGAVAFLGAVLWTIFSTREYSPAELAEFDRQIVEHAAGAEQHVQTPQWHRKSFGTGIVAGSASAAVVALFGWDKQLYVLGCGLVAFGLLQIVVASRQQRDATAGCCTTSSTTCT
jgi:hypothetical protein